VCSSDLCEMGDSGEERLQALRQYNERREVCVNALAGVNDPEAFMAVVRDIVEQPPLPYENLTAHKEHLKGGD